MSDESQVCQLTVKLTREEIAQRAKELAEKIKEHDRLDAERKANAAEIKVAIDAANTRIRELSNAVHSGTEIQDVACDWVADTDRLLMRLIRRDTGETVTTRSMTKEERQLELVPRSGVN